MSKKQTGKETLKLELDAMAQWASPGDDLTLLTQVVTAIGDYSDLPNDYDLDNATRDRLIAHSRQDAAHAVLAAGDILKVASRLESSLSWLSTWVEWSTLIVNRTAWTHSLARLVV